MTITTSTTTEYWESYVKCKLQGQATNSGTGSGLFCQRPSFPGNLAADGCYDLAAYVLSPFLVTQAEATTCMDDLIAVKDLQGAARGSPCPWETPPPPPPAGRRLQSDRNRSRDRDHDRKSPPAAPLGKIPLSLFSKNKLILSQAELTAKTQTALDTIRKRVSQIGECAFVREIFMNRFSQCSRDS